MLCFPLGVVFEEKLQLPKFSSFVLTGAKGEEVFGCALKVYEPLSETLVKQHWESVGHQEGNAMSTRNTTLYCPKSIVLVSHWPFYQVGSAHRLIELISSLTLQ